MDDTFENDDDDGEEIERVPRSRAAKKEAPSKIGSTSGRQTKRKKGELIAKGKAKSLLTSDEVKGLTPESILSSDQVEDLLSTFSGEEIENLDSSSKLKVAETSAGPNFVRDRTPSGRIAGAHQRSWASRRRRRGPPRPSRHSLEREVVAAKAWTWQEKWVSQRAFDEAKVFSATKAADRAQLGERITTWLREHPEHDIVDAVVTQSSDNEFHCIAITLFWRTKPAS
jgi:hypothetical protein